MHLIASTSEAYNEGIMNVEAAVKTNPRTKLIRDQFLEALMYLKEDNIVLVGKLIHKTASKLTLKVEQVWKDHYSGGFIPHQRIRNVPCEPRFCENLRLKDAFFVILNNSRSKEISCTPVHRPSKFIIHAFEFERKVSQIVCDGKKNCTTQVASRNRINPPQTIHHNEKRRLEVWCRKSEEVEWWFRKSKSDNWTRVNEGPTSGMVADGRKLVARNELMMQYGGYEYECRNENTQEPFSRIKINVKPVPLKSNGTCQCLNGGVCLSDYDCLCPKAYYGPSCERSSVEKLTGEQSWLKLTLSMCGLAVIFIIIMCCICRRRNARYTAFSSEPDSKKDFNGSELVEVPNHVTFHLTFNFEKVETFVNEIQK